MSVEYTNRQVIVSKLLVALDDEEKVACIFDRDDLEILIAALHDAHSLQAIQLREDLQRLRRAAFEQEPTP